MKISKDDVKHVALLSRLAMEPDELEKFTKQLGDILAYAGMLDELDIAAVPPTSHTVPLKNVFREDTPGTSLPFEEALSNAPDPCGKFFCVPKVIDDIP